jgi:hypothetical protein
MLQLGQPMSLAERQLHRPGSIRSPRLRLRTANDVRLVTQRRYCGEHLHWGSDCTHEANLPGSRLLPSTFPTDPGASPRACPYSSGRRFCAGSVSLSISYLKTHEFLSLGGEHPAAQRGAKPISALRASWLWLQSGGHLGRGLFTMLPQAYPGPTTVLINEFDAGGF